MRWINFLPFITTWLLGCGAFANASVQTAECLPDTTEARSWPVAAIYMHGLFEPGSDSPTAFRMLEQSNRGRLRQLAYEKHIRIAVPLAPAKGHWRQWNGLSLKKIEAMAQAACNGAPLAEGRDLIGFSNGAINSQKFSCDETTNYAHVFSIGAHPDESEEGTKHCPLSSQRFFAYPPHDFQVGLARFESTIRENPLATSTNPLSPGSAR